MRTRLATAVLLALPGLALAGAGLFHPHGLDAMTSGRWWHLHVPGLLVFPLVGVALMVLVRGRTDALSWVVRLAAYGYATIYTALDVIDGIGAGYLQHLQPTLSQDASGASKLFGLGGPYEKYGSWCLVVACVAVAVDRLVRHRLTAVPVLAAVVGAWFVHTDHIFAPIGVTGMVLIALATGWAAWLDDVRLVGGLDQATDRDRRQPIGVAPRRTG